MRGSGSLTSLSVIGSSTTVTRSAYSVEHRQSVASQQWLMLSVMVTFWVPVSDQPTEEEGQS